MVRNVGALAIPILLIWNIISVDLDLEFDNLGIQEISRTSVLCESHGIEQGCWRSIHDPKRTIKSRRLASGYFDGTFGPLRAHFPGCGLGRLGGFKDGKVVQVLV